MSKIYCRHTEPDSGKSCTFACLEFADYTLRVVGKHTDRNLRVTRHVNEIGLAEILQLAVAEGDGQQILKDVLKFMSAERLTDVLDSC